MINQRRAGVLLSYLSMGFNILIQFAYVPLLLHYLTKNEYGLYQLIGSLIAYMAVMDFGLSTTIVRYYSRYNALKDKVGKENILAIFSVIYIFISVICLFIGFSLYNSIDFFYSSTLSQHELESAKLMFKVLIVNVVITIPSHIYSGIISANERFVFLRLISIVQTCFKPVVVFAVFSYSASAINLVIIDSFLNFFVIGCNIFYCYRNIDFKIKFHYWDKNLVNEVLIFSFYIFLNALVDQVYWKTNQLVLGAIVGTSAVAVYSIAIQLDMAFMYFSTGISGVFLPKLSALVSTTNDMSAINDLFVRIGRIQYLILSLVFSGFLVYGKQFIILWTGNDFADAYYIALIIMVGLIIPLIQNLGISILQALNKHAFRSNLYLIIAVINFAISIPIAKMYGGIGCALVTSGALLLGNGLIINIYYYRVINLDVHRFFKEIFNLTIYVFLVVGIATIGECFSNQLSVVVLASKIFLYTIFYGLIMWNFGMNNYEKGIIIALFNKNI